MTAADTGEVAEAKRVAAEWAAELVEPGMVVGLGTGSTAVFALRRIAERLADGSLTDGRGIPTSEGAAATAAELGIPITTLEEHPVIDLMIDGADEVDPALNLIKGGGGALLREKIVAQASRREVIVVDASKRSPRLGTRHSLPVEVVEFGWRPEALHLESLAAKVIRRATADAPSFRTDHLQRTVQRLVERACGGQVVAERLLHDQARPFAEPRGAKHRHHWLEGVWRHGQVDQPPQLTTEVVLGTDHCLHEGVRRLGGGRREGQAVCEWCPVLLGELLAAEFDQCLTYMGAKALRVRGAVGAPGADDPVALGHHARRGEMKQAGQQFALGQVPGCAEENQHMALRDRGRPGARTSRSGARRSSHTVSYPR